MWLGSDGIRLDAAREGEERVPSLMARGHSAVSAAADGALAYFEATVGAADAGAADGADEELPMAVGLVRPGHPASVLPGDASGSVGYASSGEVRVGLGRVVALYDHSSDVYQIHSENRCLFF